MKSYKHQNHSKHNGIRLAAIVSSAIMMAPVALGTVSTFADASPAATQTSDSSVMTVTDVLAALNGDVTTLQSLTTSDAFSSLNSTDQSAIRGTIVVAQNLVTSTNNQLSAGTVNSGNASGLISALSSSDQAVEQAINKVNGQASTASAIATLRAQLTTFTNAYNKLTAAQQNSFNGIMLKSVLDTATSMINTNTVTQVRANNAITTMTQYLTAITGTSTKATSNQQDAIDAATAAKKEYSTVPIFLQGSSEYQKLGDLIDASADQVNDKSLSDVTAEQIAQGLNSATAAMKRLVKASVVYSGVGTIRYPKNYGIQVWTIGGKMVKNSDGTAKKLKGGTKWKVFGPILNINGSKMYNLGGDQFIDANYVSFAAKK